MKLSIDTNPMPEHDKQNTSTLSLQPQSSKIRAPDNEVPMGTNLNSKQAASQFSGFAPTEASPSLDDEGFLQLLWGHYHVLLGKLLQEVHSSEYRIPFESRFRIGNNIVSTHEREIGDASISLGYIQLDRSCSSQQSALRGCVPEDFIPLRKTSPVPQSQQEDQYLIEPAQYYRSTNAFIPQMQMAENGYTPMMPAPARKIHHSYHGHSPEAVSSQPLSQRSITSSQRRRQQYEATAGQKAFSTNGRLQAQMGGLERDGGEERRKLNATAQPFIPAKSSVTHDTIDSFTTERIPERFQPLMPALQQQAFQDQASSGQYIEPVGPRQKWHNLAATKDRTIEDILADRDVKSLPRGSNTVSFGDFKGQERHLRGVGADISRENPPSMPHRSQVSPEIGQNSNKSYNEIRTRRSVVDELLELWTISA